MAKRTIGICTYCGKEKSLERDHVIPQTLFVTLDLNMVTVPCCSKCNQKKSLGDKDLKIYVNLHAAGANHPDALTHVDRLMERGGPTAKWLGESVLNAQPIDIKTKAGIIVGQAAEFPFNQERINTTLQMIVRGLLFHESRISLGSTSETVVWEIPPGDVGTTLRKFEGYPPAINRTLGNRVAQWVGWTNFVGMTPTDTAWLLCFNAGVWFIAVTGAFPSLLQSGKLTNSLDR